MGNPIDALVTKNGQLCVATSAQAGELITGPSAIDATALVQTADGPQLAVKTISLNEGGGGESGGVSIKQFAYSNFQQGTYLLSKNTCPAYSTATAFLHFKGAKNPLATSVTGQILLSTENDDGNIGFTAGDQFELWNGTDSAKGPLSLAPKQQDYWIRYESDAVSGTAYYLVNNNYNYDTLPTSLSAWTELTQLSLSWAGKRLEIGRDNASYAPKYCTILDVKIFLDGKMFLDLQNTDTYDVYGNPLKQYILENR